MASVSQKQARRTVPRIVPAIPHRLSRAPPAVRPITPEESNKGTVTQHEPEPEPKAALEKQPDERSEEQQSSAVEAPLTPDSRASIVEKSDTETPVLGASPATSQGDQVEHGADAQAADISTKGQLNHVATMSPIYGSESKSVVKSAQRKLTIPGELPPPFYPSSKTDIHSLPVHGIDQGHAPFHRHQLSAGAVVFHSANESPSIPATPQELDGVQQQALPRPPPGFAPPQYAPFFEGHSSHPSDAVAPWLQSPYSATPGDPIYANGGGFQSASFPNGAPVDSGPYNGHFSSQDAAFAPNGAGTSHSPSPSKSQFGETKLGSDRGEEPHAVLYQNGSAPPAQRLDDSPFELAAYLSNQFGNPEFADFILQVRSPESIHTSVPVHGIVVVRSAVLADAARHSPNPSHRSKDTRRLIDILALDPFVTRDSTEEAIKVLYGAPLLAAQNFLYGLAPYLYESDQAFPSSDARRRMRQILSYIAASRMLQLPSMQARGVEIARMLLRWDTIDQVLAYALQVSSASRSQNERLAKDDPFIDAMLNYAIEFMAYTFPVDFSLYTIAPELNDAPRLPTVVDSRPPTHNPRLSKIRFGDALPEHDLQASHATKALSTILLSLPLPLVERLFNHRATANQIGWTGAVKTMRNVINERENRRQKALRSQLKPCPDGTIPPALLSNMYMEERMEQVEPSPLYPSGHRLTTQHLAGEA